MLEGESKDTRDAESDEERQEFETSEEDMAAWARSWYPHAVRINYNFDRSSGARGPFDFGVSELTTYWNRRYKKLPDPVFPLPPHKASTLRRSADFFADAFYVVTCGYKVSYLLLIMF